MAPMVTAVRAPIRAYVGPLGLERVGGQDERGDNQPGDQEADDRIDRRAEPGELTGHDHRDQVFAGVQPALKLGADVAGPAPIAGLGRSRGCDHRPAGPERPSKGIRALTASHHFLVGSRRSPGPCQPSRNPSSLLRSTCLKHSSASIASWSRT